MATISWGPWLRGNTINGTLTVMTGGVAVDATNIAATVRDPLGVITSPTPQRAGLGTYIIPIPPTAAGRYQLKIAGDVNGTQFADEADYDLESGNF